MATARPHGLSRASSALLESLRRDAFLLEAQHDGRSRIPSTSDGIKRSIDILYRQIEEVAGQDCFMLAAVDSLDLSAEDVQIQREVVVAFRRGDVRVSKTSRDPEVLRDVPLLADSIRAGNSLFDSFSAPIFKNTSHFPPPLSSDGGNSFLMCCPYMVRERKELRSQDHSVLLEEWDRIQGNLSTFIATRPFCLRDAGSFSFSDVRFAAMLIVDVGPVSDCYAEILSDWLETFHLAFHNSWNFAALIRPFPILSEIGQMRNLRALVTEVTGEIYHQAAKLRKRFDPGKGLDQEELIDLIIEGHPIRKGAVTATGAHQYRHEDSEEIRKLICIAVLEILEEDLSTLASNADLEQRTASRLTLLSHTSPTLHAVLDRIRWTDQLGFNLLREFCRMQTPGDHISFFSLAIRFLIESTDRDFIVRVPDSGNVHSINITKSNLTGLLATMKSADLPRFPAIRDAPPFTWVRPILNLFSALQIRKSTDLAFVSSVALECDAAENAKIVFELDGQTDQVWEYLSDAEPPREHTHDLRKAIYELWRLCRSSLRESVQTDYTCKPQLTFRIRKDGRHK